jgi:hypothetical protein
LPDRFHTNQEKVRRGEPEVPSIHIGRQAQTIRPANDGRSNNGTRFSPSQALGSKNAAVPTVWSSTSAIPA